ncbi:MAG: carbohydrate kinase family protein [Candidatus Paceibacterota bacterium]
MAAIDMLAIGDIVTEPFIRLKEARVHCGIDDENCEISMRWGDKIPYEFFVLVPAVGNASNAAVAAARLGLNAALRAYIGKERYGEECLQVLKSEHVDTSFMVIDPVRPTNYHYVLWYESERTILVKHEEYDYTVPDLSESPKWIYFSSLAANSEPYHHELMNALAKHPSTKLAFQPGTFQIRLGTEKLADVYARTDLLFCNKEEAQTILNSHEHDVAMLLNGLRALGCKMAVITDGRNGSYAMDESGDAWRAPMYPDPKPPLERTGAGDASAATTVSYIIKGLPVAEALLRGHINSASVVQEIGAQKGLLTAEQIEEWYSRRPADFKATAL